MLSCGDGGRGGRSGRLSRGGALSSAAGGRASGAITAAERPRGARLELHADAGALGHGSAGGGVGGLEASEVASRSTNTAMTGLIEELTELEPSMYCRIEPV